MNQKEYTISELSHLLKVTTRTIQNRLSKLPTETLGSIRRAERKGKTVQYIYNEKALSVLDTANQNENNTNVDFIDENLNIDDEIKQYKILPREEKLQMELDYANRQIKELKEQIKELKEEKKQILEHQQMIEVSHAETTKYMNTLLNQQQQITMDLQQKFKLIESPKKRGWFGK